MKINNVDLDSIAVRRSQYPENGKPEFLLVGRSNVGKSSFINTLINRKNYARTSGKPGKTKTINFYLIDDSFYLVDAPGYGYAEVSKQQREKFGMMIEEYLTKREELKQVFLIIDFRYEPKNDDKLMYNFLKHYNLPVTIVATKADKVSKNAYYKQRKMIMDSLDIIVGDDFVTFSAITKMGREEILDKIEVHI